MWFHQLPSALTRTVDGDLFLGSQRQEGIDSLSGTAYVQALVFSGRDFLNRREAGRGSYWRRWLIPVRWLSGRRRG
jgi:hypothetical protein